MDFGHSVPLLLTGKQFSNFLLFVGFAVKFFNHEVSANIQILVVNSLVVLPSGLVDEGLGVLVVYLHELGWIAHKFSHFYITLGVSSARSHFQIILFLTF